MSLEECDSSTYVFDVGQYVAAATLDPSQYDTVTYRF